VGFVWAPAFVCRCAGVRYVLDGYPRTYGEARALFAQRDGDSEELDTPEPSDSMEGIDEGDVPLDPSVTPSAVVLLEGDSEVFQKRVWLWWFSFSCLRAWCVSVATLTVMEQILSLPEAQVIGTHNNAEGFARRTAKYREANRPDAPKNTALFFEEKVKIEVLEVRVGNGDVDDAALIDKIIAPYVDVGGTAYNYHPTEEEVAAAEAKKRAEEVCGGGFCPRLCGAVC
jgi:adenylate kinase